MELQDGDIGHCCAQFSTTRVQLLSSHVLFCFLISPCSSQCPTYVIFFGTKKKFYVLHWRNLWNVKAACTSNFGCWNPLWVETPPETAIFWKTNWGRAGKKSSNLLILRTCMSQPKNVPPLQMWQMGRIIRTLLFSESVFGPTHTKKIATRMTSCWPTMYI